jgi:hypothetical protein
MGTEGGQAQATKQAVVLPIESCIWLVGKNLLSGKKLKPELQAILDLLGIRVTNIVTDHHEPMICLKGPKASLDGVAIIAKGKLAT